jgi:hypothetical protein
MTDYKKYPANWKTEIRPRILNRAKFCCEWCGAPNHAPHPETGKYVVLTIAHILNPDPMDCRDENLAALCQRCHLSYDARMHARHAAATRQRKQEVATGQLRLIE